MSNYQRYPALEQDWQLHSFSRLLQVTVERISRFLPDGLARAASWGLIDQSIISGANFVVVLTAARVLGPSNFGIFALLLTVLSFMEGTQRSLITTPHNVLGVNKSAEDYPRYTSSIGLAQFALALFFGGGSALVGMAFLQFNSAVGWMIIAMSVAAFAWQCQEFTRRVLYTESRVIAAVTGDGATYASRIAMAGVLILTGTLTGPLLMLVYGISWLIGAMVGLWNIRGSLALAFDRSFIQENWTFGRWLVASSTVAHIPRYAIAALLSAVLSVAAFGAYRAFEQLANSTNVPLSAMSNVLRPRLARQARYGPAAVWNMMLPIMIGGGVVLLLFALVLILFRGQIVGLVYGPEYVAFTAAVALVAIRPFVTLQKSLLTKALQVFQNTRSVFIGTTIGAVAGVPVGSLLILGFGLPAAGSIVILSSVVSILWFARIWHGHLSNEARWQSNIEHESAPVKMD